MATPFATPGGVGWRRLRALCLGWGRDIVGPPEQGLHTHTHSQYMVVCVLLKSCRDGWGTPPLASIVRAIDTLILPGCDGVEMTTDVTTTSSWNMSLRSRERGGAARLKRCHIHQSLDNQCKIERWTQDGEHFAYCVQPTEQSLSLIYGSEGAGGWCEGRVDVRLSLCLIKRHVAKAYGWVEVQLHAFLTSAQERGGVRKTSWRQVVPVFKRDVTKAYGWVEAQLHPFLTSTG